jgi:hypothetical protein
MSMLRVRPRSFLLPVLAALALATPLALLLLTPPATAAPQIVATTLLGEAGNETVVGVQLAADGSIFALRRSTQTVGTTEMHAESMVFKLDRGAKAVVWKVRLPEEGTDLRLDEKDVPYVLGKRRVLRLSADGAVAAMSEELGDLRAWSLAGGEVAVIASGSAIKLAGDTFAEKLKVSPGKNVVASVLLDREGGLYVSGDTNSPTGCEPYRSPFIYHYTSAGQRDWKFYDYPGPLVRLGVQYQADTSIESLSADPQGRLYFVGQSDGMNTVLTQKHWHLKESNPFLYQGCYPAPCRWYVGARKIEMIGRISDGYDELGRGSWWVPFGPNPRTGSPTPPGGYEAYEMLYGACGCRDDRYSAPFSSAISGIRFTAGGDAVIFGGIDQVRAPITADSWFGSPPRVGSFLGVLDADLTTARFATTLPGASPSTADVRGGRLVVAGSASDGKVRMPPGPDLPLKDPLQAAFGGGTRDGFLLVACLTTAAECDGPLPARPSAARKPVVKPSVEPPMIGRCDTKTGTSVLTAGELPPQASYAGAPTTPPPSGRLGAMPDGGLAPAPAPASTSDAGRGDAPAGGGGAGAGAGGNGVAGGSAGASGAAAGAPGGAARGGAGGSSVTSGGGAPDAAGEPTSEAAPDGGCGCRIGAARGDAMALLGLALGALLLGRRRR